MREEETSHEVLVQHEMEDHAVHIRGQYYITINRSLTLFLTQSSTTRAIDLSSLTSVDFSIREVRMLKNILRQS